MKLQYNEYMETNTIPNQVASPAPNLMRPCPQCHQGVLPTDNFCPHCGLDVKNYGRVSVSRQIYIYTVSALAPPFGLIWTFKFLLSSSSTSQKKWVGIVAGIITIVALYLTIWATMGLINSINQQLNTYTNFGL